MLPAPYTDDDRWSIPANSLERVPDRLSSDDKALVDSIWEAYKVYSPTKLRQMTQQETPWLRAWEPAQRADAPRQEISQAEMREFFRRRYGETALPGLDLASMVRAEEDFRLGRDVSLEEVLARRE